MMQKIAIKTVHYVLNRTFGLSLLTVFYTKRMIVLTGENIRPTSVKVLTHNA